MTLTDIIILIFVFSILISIVYFSFIKNRGSSCKGCSSLKKESIIKEYYKKKTRGK